MKRLLEVKRQTKDRSVLPWGVRIVGWCWIDFFRTKAAAEAFRVDVEKAWRLHHEQEGTKP